MQAIPRSKLPIKNMKLESFYLQNWRCESLKVLVLLVFAYPLFSIAPLQFLVNQISPLVSGPICEILSAAMIAIIIWLFCLVNSGLSKLLDYLSGAFLLGLTTILLGAVVRKILPAAIYGETEKEALRLLKLFYNIITVIPFSLLAINSFSPRKLIENLSRSTGFRRKWGLHLALTLRIFQHVGEVICRLLLVWKEEHPLLVFPRSCSDLRGISAFPGFISWLAQSVSIWIFACIILTFEPIPVMVQEMEQIYQDGENDD